LWFFIAVPACSSGTDDQNNVKADRIREAVVAGAFYPDEPAELSEMIEGFLSAAPESEIEGTIFAVVSPHAGYEYSGPVAAHGYKALLGRSFDTVIVIGPSHRYPFDGASIYNGKAYRTPLGDVPLDTKLIADLMDASEHIVFEPSAHENEHSVEVQLPFLQTVLENFKLVPMVMGGQSYEVISDVARAIAESMGKRKVLIVASTDLSHYHSRKDAKEIDGVFIDLLKKNKPAILYESLSVGRCEACGGAPVVTALIAADLLGYPEITVLSYDDSGTTSGDTERVVGYVSAVVSGEGKPRADEGESEMSGSLSPEDRTKLLEIARKTIECGLSGDRLPDFGVTSDALIEPRGVFVTLYKNGELRGCIGNTERTDPLYIAVEKAAVGAAFRDPRFFPVTGGELDEIVIEVSILSELELVEKIKSIEVGIHGLVIELGSRRGLLLPQVPVQQGWDRDEYVKNICLKAGLFPESWKDDEARLYTFTAEVFEEEK
jgi:AmmeMemoRadiSam system protein B/AmmeMemoRadiSam system protein A